jgi:hypothetical protein
LAENASIEIDQVRRNTRVDHGDFGRADRTGADVARPGWDPLDEEDLLQQADVTRDRGLGQAEFAADGAGDQ